MRLPPPDLSGLAALARDPHLDLKPVILRVQADLFVNAPARDDAMIEAFAALATGLLPTVDDETALIVAGKLAPCPDTPVEVLRMLIARGGGIRRAILARPDEAAPRAPSPARPVAEPAAADPPPAGTGPDPAASLAQARSSPALARQLLKQGDLSPGEAALLYLDADAGQRARIRDGLAPLAGLRHVLPPRADADARRRLIDRAAERDARGFAAELGRGLGLPRPLDPLDLEAEAAREVLALALHALGLAEEECIRIFLTLDRDLACSVRGVFHLADLIRTTPRAVAAHVVEAVLGGEAARAPQRHLPAMDPSGAAPRGGAFAPAARERRAAPRERRAG